jgi:hypothetical protein
MKACFSPSYPLDFRQLTGTETPLSVPGYSFTCFTEIGEVPETYWLTAAASGDFFLGKSYLQLLADHPPEGMRFVYLLFLRNGQAIGTTFGQIMEFRADEHIRKAENKEIWWKKQLAKRLHFRLLIAGNLLLTGQHAYYFTGIPDQLAGALLQEAFHCTSRQLRQHGTEISGIMVKDLPPASAVVTAMGEQGGYRALNFQPNMVFPIRAEWENMEDYLSALTSKYRVRYRRARKKAGRISRHELSLSQIRAYEAEIYQLYLNIAHEAEFCMTYLPPNYFSELKAASASGQFRLWGYFLEDKLIGFCTALWNGSEMEAHFLGLDHQQNTEHQLYLNMLYDLIETGIRGRAGRIIFSRTALEIKSSVGAQAEAATLLITSAANPFLGGIIRPLVRLLEPDSAWEERHPFK